MLTTDDLIDDAADTLRFPRFDDIDAPTDPDATSIYDLTPTPVLYVGRSTATTRVATRRRRQLRDTRENILRLRQALAAGWDIGPELAHEEQRFCALVAGA
jgi:hypothetical protein